MPRSNMYFSRGLTRGFGKVFFLRVLQEAVPGSAPRKLLGSFVDEIDYGFGSTKSAPGMDHAWDAEYFLKIAAALPNWAQRPLVVETDLAGFTSEYKIETKAGANAKAAFPGAPVSAGIEVDYSKLRRAKVTMGAGSKKLYIPQNYISAAYEEFIKNPGAYDKILFDDDCMLVDQIVLVKNLTIEVESHSSFGFDFEAKATKVSDLSGGLDYKKTSDRTYSVSISDGKEYLFGIGAVEADKYSG